MIDIHTHILPGIDDGSKSMKESILMAKLASESGVHTIIVTPHCNLEGVFDNYYNDDLINSFQAFKLEVEKDGIALNLFLGMEIYGTEEVPELLKKGKLITLNHSRYLLLEFGFREDLALTEFLINEVINQGFHPVIAHPERYPYVQSHPSIVYDWIAQGCSIQINKGSISGSFGYHAKHTAFFLLENKLVSLIASDAHSPYHRTTDLSETYQIVSNYFTKDYADVLLNENPNRVIEDKQLIKYEMMPGEKIKIWF